MGPFSRAEDQTEDDAVPPAAPWTAAELAASIAPPPPASIALEPDGPPREKTVVVACPAPADGAVEGGGDPRAELRALRAEMNLLRRRDDTLKFYMARLDEELRLAARLQQDFLPKSLPQVGAVRFHTLFRPAGYVSGDLYDVMRLDESHVGFFLVDAVGHGMPAALLTMFIKRALVVKEIDTARHADGYRLLPPGEALGRVNEALVEQNLSQATFATAIYGTIDVRTLELTLSSAGHPHPLLLRDGVLEELPAHGTLMGIFAGERYEDVRVALRPGDRLLVFSDGVEIAFAGDETGDARQWRQELLDRRRLTAEAMLVSFSERLDHEAGSLAPKDDLTMVMVEVLSGG